MTTDKFLLFEKTFYVPQRVYKMGATIDFSFPIISWFYPLHSALYKIFKLSNSHLLPSQNVYCHRRIVSHAISLPLVKLVLTLKQICSAVPGKTWEPKHSTESESIVQGNLSSPSSITGGLIAHVYLAAFFSTVASLLPTKPAEDLYNVEANPELWTNLREIDIDVENFYLYGQAHKIKPNFTVHLTPVCYS